MKGFLRKLMNLIKTYSLLLKLIFLASVIFFVTNQITHIVQGMTWEDLRQILASLGTGRFFLLVILGMISITPMLLYDLSTVRILQNNGKGKINSREFIKEAWTTNTINNLIGFGGLIGATLRANFYGDDVPNKKKVAATVSKVALFLISGLSILCFLALIDVTLIQPKHPYQHYWIWFLGGSLYAPALLSFIYLKRNNLFVDVKKPQIVSLLMASVGQWLGATIFFMVLGYLLKVPERAAITSVDISSFWQIFPLFLVSTLIGMLSLVPGGMGTFDVLMILGLNQIGMQKELAVAWLLYYRLFYYLFPFTTGVALLLHRTSKKINQVLGGIPRLITQKSAHFALVCLLYFAGVMMILLSTVPNLSNISWLFSVLTPYSFDFLDQTLNMLIGVILIGLARGIASKVKKSYFPTLGLLAFCIINTISRTVSWKLITFYVLVMFCVYLSRNEFYRKQFVYSWEAAIFDGVLATFLFILYAVVGYFSTDAFGHGATPEFFLFPSDDVWLSGLLGIILSLVVLKLLFSYLSDSDSKPLGSYFDKIRIDAFLRKQGQNTYSSLLYLPNRKYYFYKQAGQDVVLFQFKEKANKVFVLGEPLGDKNYWYQATLAFTDDCDLLNRQVAFYDVRTSKFMAILHEFGYEFTKIGETGLVELDSNFSGNQKYLPAIQQAKVKQLSEQGYQFKLLQPPLSNKIIQQLKDISDQWIDRNEEQVFSTAYFQLDYIKRSPVGIMEDKSGKILGFVSVNPKEVASYDMIRWTPEAPENSQDFLLVNLLSEVRELGSNQFNMGLVLLEHVGRTKFSFVEERLLNTWYHYGSKWNDYQAINQFKRQYINKWQPSYLAYQRPGSRLFLFFQFYTLNRHKKNPMISVEQVLGNRLE